MTRDRNNILRLEKVVLRQNVLAHLGQGQPVRRRCVELLQATRRLNRLKGNAADALLLQREIDDPPQLAIVAPLFHRHDQRGGNIMLVEPVERLLPDSPQIGPAQLLQRPLLQESNCR